MAMYRVRFFRSGVGFVDKSINAADEDQIKLQLEPTDKIVSVSATKFPPNFFGFGGEFAVDVFAREMLTLLDAGMTIVEAIAVLESKSKASDGNNKLRLLKRRLEEGLSFSKALESISGVFPELFVAGVRSSEVTGNVSESLRRYLDYKKKINNVRNKLISVSIYPAILFCVAGCLILFMAFYVVPRFAKIYSEMGRNLPWMSRVMIFWANVVHDDGVVLLFLASIVVLGGWWFVKKNVGVMLINLFWKVPFVGEKLKIYELARFTRTLSLLLEGGIAFVPALKMTSQVLSQPVLQLSVKEACEKIESGALISDVFAQTKLTTEVGVRLLSVGERTGELPDVLLKMANMFDQQLEQSVEWMSRLLEPMIMIVIGFLIGVIILLMYMPIFELANLIH